MQLWTAFLLLDSLGLEVRLHERPDIIEKCRDRYVKRKLTKKVRAQAGIIEPPPDVRVSRAKRPRQTGPQSANRLVGLYWFLEGFSAGGPDLLPGIP
jgi:hypothetical protein